jgi:hypothetical protein
MVAIDSFINILFLQGTFLGYLTIGVLIFIAIIGAIIGWKFSDLFIPPLDNWSRSFIAILAVKAGIALTAAYFAVIGFSFLITWLFGK